MSGTLDGVDRSLPLVRQIQAAFRDRIRSGELQPGTKLPSMRRLSVDFGCSLGIVKQAVNTLSAQGYLRSSPRRGVYVASVLPAGREIAVVLPHLEIERLHLAMRGIKRGLDDSGHRVSLHAGAGPTDRNSLVPDYLSAPHVAGVLLLLPSAGEHEELMDLLRNAGVPTAVVDIVPRASGADVVAIDLVETGRVGARHLLDRGHRVVCLVEPMDDHRSPPEVVEGIKLAFADRGLDIGEGLVRIEVNRQAGEPGPAWLPARAAVEPVLAQRTDATGVIGLGPQLTLGAALAARRLGRAIPRDLSIVGLLGDSSALQTMEPPVTIIDNPLFEICERAARRLLERIDGMTKPPESIRCAPVMTERESVRDVRDEGGA